MKWHPYAETFPLLEGEEREAFRQSIKAAGGAEMPIIYRMKDGEMEGLDGRNRFRECSELNLPFPTKVIQVADDDVEEFIDVCNVHRRHLSAEQRKKRIKHMRSRGESTRKIAERMNVSQSTVNRDLENNPGESNDSPASPEPVKVKGKDGKLYSKNRKKTGPRKGKALQNGKAAKGGGGVVPQPDQDYTGSNGTGHNDNGTAVAVDDAEPMDAFQNPLPKKLRKVYLDPWLQDTINYLERMEESLRHQQIVPGMAKREKNYPFINSDDVKDGIGFTMNYIAQVLDHLRQQRPAGICPSCAGKGCTDCNMCGMVPRKLYEQLKHEHDTAIANTSDSPDDSPVPA